MQAGRVLAIGDIHGCAKTLSHLLKLVRLDKSDTLYLLGDLIDRGPDTKGVIDMILDLQKDGFDIRGVKGNHEDMLLLAVHSSIFEDLIEWLENGGGETLKSFGADHPGMIPVEYIEFIGSLPLYWQNETHIFVHAGLSCDLTEPVSPGDRRDMLWKRSEGVNASHLSGKKLVTGHSVITLDKIRASLKTNHIQIDNGCVYGDRFPGTGNLVAIDLGTNELFIQENIDNSGPE